MPSPRSIPAASPIESLDQLPTIDASVLGAVTGGAGSDMSSMMPMMMMMMMKQRQQAPQVVAAAPVAPGSTVNGVQQAATLGADGSYNYMSEG